MTAFWALLSVAVVVVWIVTLRDVFRRDFDRARTLAWVLIVVLLPLAGSLLYWVLRPREARGRG